MSRRLLPRRRGIGESGRRIRTTPRAVRTDHLGEPAVLSALLESSPLTALIRNLGNLTRAGVLTPFSEGTQTVVRHLSSPDSLHRSRVHPMAIFLALRTYASGTVRGPRHLDPCSAGRRCARRGVLRSASERCSNGPSPVTGSRCVGIDAPVRRWYTGHCRGGSGCDGGAALDVPADGHTAGEADEFDAIVGHEKASIFIRERKHVESAIGPARLLYAFGEKQRAERRLGRGLQDHGATGGNRRSYFVSDEVDGEIKGRDAGNRAERKAAHDAPTASGKFLPVRKDFAVDTSALAIRN